MAGGLFSACLDIPETPGDNQNITSVEVFAKQFDKTIEVPIKLNSDDSAELIAEVTPNTHKKNIKYYWYNEEELLDSGSTYVISTTYMASTVFSKVFIPNRLVIKDNEGNTLETTFTIIVNNPPQVSSQTIPANGDTLYGNSHTPFLFSWQSIDRNEEESLLNILEIDGIRYNVGELHQVMQSGLTEGKHTFRIIVEDSMGDRDSTILQEFLVIDTLEAK